MGDSGMHLRQPDRQSHEEGCRACLANVGVILGCICTCIACNSIQSCQRGRLIWMAERSTFCCPNCACAPAGGHREQRHVQKLCESSCKGSGWACVIHCRVLKWRTPHCCLPETDSAVPTAARGTAPSRPMNAVPQREAIGSAASAARACGHTVVKDCLLGASSMPASQLTGIASRPISAS